MKRHYVDTVVSCTSPMDDKRGYLKNFSFWLGNSVGLPSSTGLEMQEKKLQLLYMEIRRTMKKKTKLLKNTIKPFTVTFWAVVVVVMAAFGLLLRRKKVT